MLLGGEDMKAISPVKTRAKAAHKTQVKQETHDKVCTVTISYRVTIRRNSGPMVLHKCLSLDT